MEPNSLNGIVNFPSENYVAITNEQLHWCWVSSYPDRMNSSGWDSNGGIQVAPLELVEWYD